MATVHVFAAVLFAQVAVPPVDRGELPGQRSGGSKATVRVTDFGAKGDTATDDTGPFEAAAKAAAGGTLIFPAKSGAYRITDTITIPPHTRVVGSGARILMALPPGHSTGRLFLTSADDVTFDGLWIDGAGAPTTAAGNRYAISIVGTAGRHLHDVRVRNCRFTNLPWANAKAVLATHAVYNKWADFTTVEHSSFDSVSGAAVFISQSIGTLVANNDIKDTGWYSIQLQDRVDGALIAANRIAGAIPGGRMWGGSVNLMSNGRDLGAGKARDEHILIAGNSISGVHSYTAAVQIESSSYVSFTHNTLRDISLTNHEPPEYVRIYTRPQGNKTDEGATTDVDVSENTLLAKGKDCVGIYVDNQRFGGQSGYASGLTVRNNKVSSPDPSNTFSHAIIVNGQAGGWKDIEITGNSASGSPLNTPQSGLIGIVGRPSAPITDVVIARNSLSFTGTAANPTHLGIAVEAHVDRVTVQSNDLRGFWHGIRTFANSRSVDVATNTFAGIVNVPMLLAEKSPAQVRAAATPRIHEFSITNVTASNAGADAIMGVAKLVAGSVSVKTSHVVANSRILLGELSMGVEPAGLRVSGQTASTGFTITSSNATDASEVAWLIVDVRQ